MTTEGRETFERGLVLIIACCIFLFTGFAIGRCTKECDSSRPVEEIIKADSIVKVNDSIKIKVEQLDSIKDAKIIEVQTLDNDSTLKLFYKLISK